MVISMIMLIARIWDALNDPMFGSIAENTQSKWGRFRPYILYGAPILALFNCLTFLNLDIPNGWKAIWCGFTYIGCGMAYTAVNISVGCLANSMTAVNTQRVSLNAFRGVMGGDCRGDHECGNHAHYITLWKGFNIIWNGLFYGCTDFFHCLYSMFLDLRCIHKRGDQRREKAYW